MRGKKEWIKYNMTDFAKSYIMKEFLAKLLGLKKSTIQETMSRNWLVPSDIDDCVQFLKLYIWNKYWKWF